MELTTAIETRASIRRYTTESVPLQDIKEMVRLAGRAPSVNNCQPWRYIVIGDLALRDRMADTVRTKLQAILPNPQDALHQRAFEQLCQFSGCFGQAPVTVAVATRTYRGLADDILIGTGLSPHDASAMRNHPDAVSLGASIQNFLLAATGLGYATCWLTGPLVAARELEQILEITHPWRLGAVISLGRPAEPLTNVQAEKAPLDEILDLRM